MATTTSDPLMVALEQHFGFGEFRLGQRSVIEDLLAGRSAAAIFPTGSGKSLCYQLPALMLEGVTLVVSPLIALMKDQIDALRARGIAARRLDSTLSFEEYRNVMDELRSGVLRILYVAPERFSNERFRETMLRTRVALFAVDEAHCISEWGHNFRPDYLKLAEFARQCRAERILALTATATRQVAEDIARQLSIDPACITRTGVYRPNLTLLSTPVSDSGRDPLLLERLRTRSVGPAIVYVTLQHTAEEVAEKLQREGFAARAYHAGMKDDVRSDTQDWFLSSDSGIVVATIAFGMGVDKPNIRYVYHYNLPKSLESYAQEIGRAGRDGEPSICEMLVCLDDLNVLENFAHGDTPTQAAVQELVRRVFQLGEDFDLSYHELSTACDIRLLVVRTLLTYLELLGYLQGGTPFFAHYRFKPLCSSQQILERFEGERRQFLASLLRLARQARTWFEIDVDFAAQALGAPRERVVRALDYLQELGLLEVANQGVRHRYRRLRTCANAEALADELHAKTLQREQRELERLQQVLKLAESPQCQVRSLCEYFGESLAGPCGHCTSCLQPRAATQFPRPQVKLEPHIRQQARSLRVDYPLLKEPHLMARFLSGVTTPSLTKARLSQHPLFGAAAHVPYGQLIRAMQEG